MEVTAVAKNIRVSPKKVRLVVDQIKKLSPEEALLILEFIPKSSSKALKKVIKSAIANATNNSNLPASSLKFKEVQVGKGITFKRYRAVSRGRAHSILKTTSHIRVVLEGEQEKKVTKVTEEPKEVIEKTSDTSISSKTTEINKSKQRRANGTKS